MAFYVDISGRLAQKHRFMTYTYKILDHFFGERLKRDVDINIDVVTRLEGTVVGECDGDKETINITLARRDGKKKLSVEDIARTLAHELVHAKQFLRGEMKTESEKWRYKSGFVKDCSNLPYREQPWEKEAFKLEPELFDLYWK